MKNPKHPFRLNLGFLLPQQIGYSHEFQFDFPKLKIADDLELHDFHGLVTVSRTPQGLLMQGKFQSKLEIECSRCLKPYEHALNWEMAELYAFKSRATTESDLILPDNATIDIQEFIIEDAQLEVPIKPICKPDCQGLCQECGMDLNLGDCGHEDIPHEEISDEENSPFAGLKDLL